MAEKDIPAGGLFDLKEIVKPSLPKDFSVFRCLISEHIGFMGPLSQMSREMQQYIWDRRRESPSTSIFLNFDPFCNLHQLMGKEGEVVREAIAAAVKQRCVEILNNQFKDLPRDHPVQTDLIFIKNLPEVKISPFPQEEFLQNQGRHSLPEILNNGEVRIWWPGICLKEELIFNLLKILKQSLNENRIKVKIKEKEYEVLFNGWGFRYE
ncbi:MAG: hypothetical protein ACPLW9_02895 [Minisyncoccales bacterium]